MGTYRITGYVGVTDGRTGKEIYREDIPDLLKNVWDMTVLPSKRPLNAASFLASARIEHGPIRSREEFESILTKNLPPRPTAPVAPAVTPEQQAEQQAAAAAAAEAAEPKGLTKYMGQAADLAKNKKAIIAASLVGAALLAWLVSRRK